MSASLSGVHPDLTYEQRKKDLGVPAGYEWDQSWNAWVKPLYDWNYSDSAFNGVNIWNPQLSAPAQSAAAPSGAGEAPAYQPSTLPAPVQAPPTAVGAPGSGAFPQSLMAGRNYIGDIPSGWATGARNRGTGLGAALKLSGVNW